MIKGGGSEGSRVGRGAARRKARKAKVANRPIPVYWLWLTYWNGLLDWLCERWTMIPAHTTSTFTKGTNCAMRRKRGYYTDTVLILVLIDLLKYVGLVKCN